jgi:hypothetical protein
MNPAFTQRVFTAKDALKDGANERDVRAQHGGVVLRYAHQMMMEEKRKQQRLSDRFDGRKPRLVGNRLTKEEIERKRR